MILMFLYVFGYYFYGNIYRSKAILQQARLQAELSLQKREEEEKKYNETLASTKGYDSDELDNRLAKYIGTYDLKSKIPEKESSDDEKGKENEKDYASGSEDFEDYKKQLGLNLSLGEDEYRSKEGSKVLGDRGSKKDGSMHYSRESLGEIKDDKAGQRKWSDNEGESDGEYKKKDWGKRDADSDYDKRSDYGDKKDDYNDDFESEGESDLKKDRKDDGGAKTNSIDNIDPIVLVSYSFQLFPSPH
jgi:hypothetical protein